MRAIIIKHRCLRVESATTFLKSGHSVAMAEVIIKVIAEIVASASRVVEVSEGVNRKSRYTPAVTRVLECTKEEIGVGAAMASGSHTV